MAASREDFFGNSVDGLVETWFTQVVSETTTQSSARCGKEATMATILTVDISNTVGQESAIQANGSPVFTIKVTSPAEALPDAFDGTKQEICGFGRVVSGGPVNGYEVLYKLGSVVEPTPALQHRDGLVVFA